MTTDDSTSRGFSLKRWSRRKLEFARGASATATASEAVRPSATASEAPGSTAAFESASSAAKAARPAAARASPLSSATVSAGEETTAPSLPPIESLTIESDFSVFLGSTVDPAIKLKALKKLFQDPRFNVMDGLDVYIDDYSIPDPLEPEIARTLAHARYALDPPRTRVNEAGIVEDVPADEASTEARALPSEATTSPEATSLADATSWNATLHATSQDATSSDGAVPPTPTPNLPLESAADEAKSFPPVEPTRR